MQAKKEPTILNKIVRKQLGREPIATERDQFTKVYQRGVTDRYQFFHKEQLLGTIYILPGLYIFQKK